MFSQLRASPINIRKIINHLIYMKVEEPTSKRERHIYHHCGSQKSRCARGQKRVYIIYMYIDKTCAHLYAIYIRTESESVARGWRC